MVTNSSGSVVAEMGHYPINWWTYVIGYGPTLHIPGGPGGLDSPSTFLFDAGPRDVQ